MHIVEVVMKKLSTVVEDKKGTIYVVDDATQRRCICCRRCNRV